MDPHLRQFISEDTPKLNPLLANGLATYHFKKKEKYIDDVFRDVFKNFKGGFYYKGIKRITPYEEYEQTKKKKGKDKREVYDLAQSDLYMVRVQFEFDDPKTGMRIPVNRYLYLPYVGDAGRIILSGARYFISPVLADKVISVQMNDIFVRVQCDKLTFARLQHKVCEDQKYTLVNVPWSSIHHKNAKARQLRPKVKTHQTIAHYLFAYYGLGPAFEKLCGFKPIVSDELKVEDYPDEDWVIYSTGYPHPKIKPKGCRGVSDWVPSRIKIAVPRNQNTDKVRSLVAGFFYVADHYPDRIVVDRVDSDLHWKRILGISIFSESISEGTLLQDVMKHFKSLNHYVDPVTAMKLKRTKKAEGKIIENIFDLFDLIIERIDKWLINAGEEVSTMYDKEFSILYFVFQEITTNIYLLYYKLSAAAEKGLTLNEVNNILNATIRVGLIHDIRRNHGEVRVETTSGDNKALKITGIQVPQSSSNAKGGRRDNSTLDDPSKRLHASVAEVGGYLNVPKNDPSGRSRINQFQIITNQEDVTRNPAFVQLLDETQMRIKRD